MKKLTLLAICISLASCSKEPNVAVRIDCGDYNDKGLQATLNDQPVGDCPVDIMVHAGEVNVSARKDNDDASYLFAEAKMTLAENAMKRIKLDIQPVFTEEYYYRKATDSVGMQTYLATQPDGKRRSEITDKLEQYYFDKTTDITGMQTYLEKQPDGKRRSEVTDKLEQYYFDKATDIAGMKAYLEKQPDGKRKAEVERRLKTERTKLENFAPGLVMVKIPAGSFMMGCSEGDSHCLDDEKPRHKVNIPAFALSKTEVTFTQYDVFAKATNRKIPEDSKGWGRGNRPVIYVIWPDAVAYTEWLSAQTGQKFRLPSEAEWEYAARAGSTSKYSWGSVVDCTKDHFGASSSFDICYGKTKNGYSPYTVHVGSFSANNFGLYDMSGNVSEMTQDCYNSNYNNAPTNGSAWQNGDCDRRVVRGGAWQQNEVGVRVSARSGWGTARNYITDSVGFRVAQDLPQ